MPRRFVTRCIPWLIRCGCSGALLLGGAVAAQDPALTDALATVLQAADERRWDGATLTAAARHPDRVVRRHATLAMGRIGDPAAVPYLVELLADPDTGVAADAAFALRLLGAQEGVSPLRAVVLRARPPEPGQPAPPVEEAAARALAAIGGPDAAEAIRTLLTQWISGAVTGILPPAVNGAVWDAWRLGAAAPVDLLVEYAGSALRDLQLGAVYSLARLRASAAADVLLRATDHADPVVRLFAVRALDARFADSTGLDRAALGTRVRRLVSDPDPQVRITALRTLATYRDPELAEAAIDRLSDSDPNARVQALAALGDLGGPAAEAALAGAVREARQWAQRRQALISYARVGGVRALEDIRRWLTTDDWTWRAAGAEALGYIPADTVVPWLVYLTDDPDGRVAAVAFQSLVAIAPDHATPRARPLLTHADPVVRAVAADRLAADPDTAHLTPLAESWQRAAEDSILDARLAILAAVGRTAALGFRERIAAEDHFLARVAAPDEYLLRRAALERYPEAARRWGPPTPIATGYTLADYRDVVQRVLLPAEQGERLPGLVLDTDRGRIEIELYPQDAPLTVHRLLQLVDARLFDGGRWHRVVPNFVIQDGDPRGDGWGGPGFALRDENSRRRYERGAVGLALGGDQPRDTGGSQFFIVHGRQPHLDGTYPLFGRVISDMRVIDDVTQGDRIRQVRRR